MLTTDENRGADAPPSALERGVGYLAVLGAGCAAVLVLVSLAIVGYSVVMRYVLNTPVTWVDELTGFLVVGIVMLGAADALRRGDHISVDLLTTRLHGGARRIAAIWWMIAVLLVSAALIYSGEIMVRFSHEFEMYSEGYLELPMWIPQSVLLAGAVLLALMAVGRIFSLLTGRAPDRAADISNDGI